MVFTLPSYIRTLPLELASAELLERAGDDSHYRLADFEGLDAHEKLLRKLAILTARGSYLFA